MTPAASSSPAAIASSVWVDRSSARTSPLPTAGSSSRDSSFVDAGFEVGEHEPGFGQPGVHHLGIHQSGRGEDERLAKGVTGSSGGAQRRLSQLLGSCLFGHARHSSGIGVHQRQSGEQGDESHRGSAEQRIAGGRCLLSPSSHVTRYFGYPRLALEMKVPKCRTSPMVKERRLAGLVVVLLAAALSALPVTALAKPPDGVPPGCNRDGGGPGGGNENDPCLPTTTVPVTVPTTTTTIAATTTTTVAATTTTRAGSDHDHDRAGSDHDHDRAGSDHDHDRAGSDH